MKKFVLKKKFTEGSSGSQNYKIDYAKELNDQQYKAVMHNNGAALVIAGAGTGKTRTLVYRVARLIEDGVEPSSILLLTFTRKSAQEMIQRASLLLDGRCEKISGGTFHSFAANILRKYAKNLGYESSFNILDQGDSEDTINLIRSNFISASGGKYKSKKRFPKKNTIQSVYSASVNKRMSVHEVIESEYNYFIEESEAIGQIISAYSDYKKRSNLMDYDDLLVNLYILLKEHPKVLAAINSKHKYIMVDEYQDTNRLQHEIVLLLAGNSNNIMAVGDDAQSIYSFRGADYQNIFFFPESFEKCEVFKIEENYRSNQPILDFTNHVINSANFKYEKHLFSQKESEDKPAIISCENERQQSLFVVQQVVESREEGIPLDDMAVLFRSNFHSFDLEIELTRANIPYKKFGGFKFVETAHVKDLLAFIRIAFNYKDIVAWGRILRLIKGVGPVTVNKITESISEEKIKIDSFLDELPKGNVRADLISLFKKFEKISNKKISPGELSDYFTNYYTPFLKDKYSDDKKRIADLDTFTQIAERYKSLAKFINDMALEPPSGAVGDIEGSGNEDEYLTLSTIHSAKGLEWSKVFVVWALDGKFPSTRAADSIDQIEEERRLFYVASTRAKDELYISYPTNVFDRETGFVLSKPSRFISDISEDLADRYTLVQE